MGRWWGFLIIEVLRRKNDLFEIQQPHLEPFPYFPVHMK